MKPSILFVFLSASVAVAAQDKSLPYYEIPAYPAAYTATTVIARMIDGAGFRYYWATEGLRPDDLNHRPSKDARSSRETLEHIYGLTNVIINSVNQVPTTPGTDYSTLSFKELRQKTLGNLKAASDKLKSSKDSDLNNFDIVFKRDSESTTFPFWNQLNGPIADVLWHIGQVISFRRSSGNPYNSNASVFTGTVREGGNGEQ